jgi:hypothetical protein
MTLSFRRRNCVIIAVCHCETPLGRCGNLIYSRTYGIASLIIFARKDIATQFRGPESMRLKFILSLRGAPRAPWQSLLGINPYGDARIKN